MAKKQIDLWLGLAADIFVWRMVGGNPVEKHYDRFCDRYNGKKFVLTDAIKDRYGIYHTDVIYEIVFEQEGSK